ncbi:hypothetical protein CPB83DRAFT_926533, partial [Crepidotus variabilis]
LSASEDEEVTKILNQSGQVAIVGRYSLTDKDMERLKPFGWLNDEILNCYCEMIRGRARHSKLDWQLLTHPSRVTVTNRNVLVFDSFFFSKLSKGYFECNINRWTKNENIFAKDLILIPVNHSNNHWTAACINFLEKRIE